MTPALGALAGVGVLLVVRELMRGGVVGFAAHREPAKCGVHGPTATPALRDAVLGAFAKRGYPRDEMSRAIALESGWHPQALNCDAAGRGRAAGLVQFINPTLHSLGFRGGPAAFASMTEAEQQPYYSQFASRVPRWQVPGDAHVMLAAPAYVGRADGVVVYPVGSAAWRANPSIRDGAEGPITVGSIRRTVLS